MSERTYKEQNAFERSYFPAGWDDEDIEFLAEFVDREFGARLMVEGRLDYPYILLVEAGDES
jgi:hypothetical protein